MKCSARRFAAFLIDFKSMMFGLAIFALVWVSYRSHDYCFPTHVFFVVLLLVSSILIRLDKRWSNLIAAIINGFLPLEFVRAFLMFPHLAEVHMFSSEHFHYFFR